MALPHSTDCGEGLSQVRPHCEGQTAKTEGLGASCSRGGGPPVTPVPAPQQPPRRHLGPAAPTLPGGVPSPSPNCCQISFFKKNTVFISLVLGSQQFHFNVTSEGEHGNILSKSGI